MADPKRPGAGRESRLDFLQQVLSGCAIGCIYALVALGFVLIYKATEIINFAQGELLMLGAYFGYTFIDLWGLNYFAGALLAVAMTALVGALLERVLIRPMTGQPAFSIVMVTLGLGIVLRAVVTMVPGWGTESHTFATPFSNRTVTFGPLILAQDHVAIILVTCLLVGLLYAFFTRTRIGVAMQAASQNQMAAGYMGIPIKRVSTLIWAMSAAVAAIAGVLLAPVTFIHSHLGFIGIKAFPAAVLGGFGSMPGAVVGGLILGVCESLAGFYLPEGVKDVTAYVLLLAVLAFRPQGLFGQTAAKKV